MEANEVEFLAEKELISIVPNFSQDKIYLIGVSICTSGIGLGDSVWPKTRPGPRKRGQLGLKSGPARPEPFTCHY